MYLLTILASVTALASYAVAAPTKTSGGDDAGVCGNNQKLACWNSELDLLGINCLSVPILDVPIQQSCGSEVPACCPTQEDDGLINLNAQCVVIQL